MARMKRVAVLIDDQHRDKLQKIIPKLKAKGLTDIKTQEMFGMIQGVIPENQVGSLRDVGGVEHVEQEQELRLPPSETEST